MLPRERVLAALDHREPDLVPWGEHLIDYNVYEDILGRETLVHAKFRETKALWDGQRDEVVAHYKRDIPALADALGMDLLTIGRCPSKLGRPEPMEQLDHETFRDDAGHVYRISATTHNLMTYKMNPDAYTPPTMDSLCEEIDKVDRGEVDEPDDSAWEVVDDMVARFKPTHYIVVFAADMGWPGFGQTAEDQFMSLLDHPDMCAKVAELQGKRAKLDVRRCAKHGMDAIMPPGDMGTSTATMADPKIYYDLVQPWHKAYCDEAHRLGLRVLKHSCGHIWPLLDGYVDAGYDAYEGIQASAGMDMKRLKETYGDRLTLWGGVTNENLILGTPDDVRADAHYAIQWGAPGGGFIYGASHSIAVGATRDNVLAMKEARDRWGTYPIAL